MASLHVKKGDLVQIISGKDKGVTGKILKVDPKKGLVTVEGVNRVKKHTKVAQAERGAKSGGILTVEAPIDSSNVMPIVEADNRATRVGYKREKVDKRRADGTTYSSARSVRVSRRTGEEL
jgi:large subunit ribosomal protein L24